MRRKRIVLKWCLWLAMTLGLTLGMAGCRKATDVDTGKQFWTVDPNKAQKIEQGAEAAGRILAILGILWPVLLPAGAGVAGALAVWRKYKPKLTQAESEALLYHTLGSVTVDGIEEFKKLYPEEWKKLIVELEAVKGKILSAEERRKIENLIRALRGLPPKE